MSLSSPRCLTPGIIDKTSAPTVTTVFTVFAAFPIPAWSFLSSFFLVATRQHLHNVCSVKSDFYDIIRLRRFKAKRSFLCNGLFCLMIEQIRLWHLAVRIKHRSDLAEIQTANELLT